MKRINTRLSGINPPNCGSRLGFTLAEALITLMIIGVVAVFTIPTLITYVRVGAYSTQFKKAISSLSQAALSGIAAFDLDYAAANTVCNEVSGGVESPSRVYSFCSLFNGTTRSRFIGRLDSSVYSINLWQENPVAIPEGQVITFDNNTDSYLAYELAEGTMFAFKKNAANCLLNNQAMSMEWISNHPQCIGFVDVTGYNGPNRVVNCDVINPAVIDLSTSCRVPFDTKHMTDIYPIVYQNAAAIPITAASRAVAIKVKRTLSTDKDWIEHPD